MIVNYIFYFMRKPAISILINLLGIQNPFYRDLKQQLLQDQCFQFNW